MLLVLLVVGEEAPSQWRLPVEVRRASQPRPTSGVRRGTPPSRATPRSCEGASPGTPSPGGRGAPLPGRPTTASGHWFVVVPAVWTESQVYVAPAVLPCSAFVASCDSLTVNLNEWAAPDAQVPSAFSAPSARPPKVPL